MKPSLSLILPVRNAQATLKATIVDAAELLGELTPRWNVLVVDDASTDATCEVADELPRHFPQVSVVHQPAGRSQTSWYELAAKGTCGEIVLIRDAACELDLACAPKLWASVASHDLVVARQARPTRQSWAMALSHRVIQRAVDPAMWMIRRTLLNNWMLAARTCDFPRWVADQRCSRLDIAVVAYRAKPLSSAARSAHARSTARDRQDHATQQPNRPNYLKRLKEFALGE